MFKPKSTKQKTLANLFIRPVLKEILKRFLHDPNRGIEIKGGLRTRNSDDRVESDEH